jgi:hypothetical protein
MFINRKLFGATLLLAGLLLSVDSYADKTDIVILVNGNAVTGEIKSLEFGTLRYSTDSMGTVSIDWEDIVSVTSEQSLEIELTGGSRYYGRLLKSDEESGVRVKTASQEVSLVAREIVGITPIETHEKLWKRLEGSFSFGFQTQKSSGVTTANTSADVQYRARTFLLGLRLNSAITEQPTLVLDEKTTTARQNIEGNYQRFRRNRWFTDWFAGWEQNDELGIAGRTSVGWAAGRYLVQTNRNQFSLTAGVQASQTSFTSEDEVTTEAEGRIETRYLHRNLYPESILTFTSQIFPLLKDLSQYRAETDLSFRREIFNDFFWDLTIGYSYLSDPPEGASSSDHNIATSIGYKF